VCFRRSKLTASQDFVLGADEDDVKIADLSTKTVKVMSSPVVANKQYLIALSSIRVAIRLKKITQTQIKSTP
jgi:hypothetical protein